MEERSSVSPGVRPVCSAIVAHAPPGWSRADAAFAMTVDHGVGTIVYWVDDRPEPVPAPESLLMAVREHRAQYAAGGEPWWRIVLSLSAFGDPEVEYDYGAVPFPADQLFEPEHYRADLLAYPRKRLPVWLAAYVGHDGRQSRPPGAAAEQARADLRNEVWPRLTVDEFPAFPAMWARWATIAAAFVAVGSDRGPRIAPWTGIFEAENRSGCTLRPLPGGRAVLSGGVWEAEELDAAYNGATPMPNLFAGAPDWVSDATLDPRAATGLLSFCYWWESGYWYHGEAPHADRCVPAVPGMWTSATTIQAIGELCERDDEVFRAAVVELLGAAEVGAVRRELLSGAFGENADTAGAFQQFFLAGLASTMPPPMPAGAAVARVRDYITGHGLDTARYPHAELVAERFGTGWMVYVPVPKGELVVGRAIFYLADDGVLEPSSSAVAPSIFIAEFEQRFARRHGLLGNSIEHKG